MTDARMKPMQHHPTAITIDAFYCKRSHSGEVVHVYNSDNYLMAEYTVRTGHVSWQRVAPITKRESVEEWLRNNYPAILNTPKNAPVGKVKAKAAGQ